MPITFLHIIVAIAYCKVFHSFWYGFLFAVPVIFVGTMLGALVVLYLGRFLIADYIKKQINRSKREYAQKFKVVDSMFLANGILFVALLRLMFIPFGLTSYLLGVTCISVFDYMVGTATYLIKIVLIVFLGCSIYQAAEDRKEGQENQSSLIIIIVEIVLTVIASIIITIWAKIYFDKRYDEFEKAIMQMEEKMKDEMMGLLNN
jgi:uncharacterized membrane protein YdjX (TVP38/TMEM64 family)